MKNKDISAKYYSSIYFIGVLAVLITLGGVLTWGKVTHNVSERSIYALEEFYLQEISERNVSAITQELVHRKDVLERAVAGLEGYFSQSEAGLQTYITLVQRINGFNSFSLVDQYGMVYTADTIFDGNSMYDFLGEPVVSAKLYTVSTRDSKVMLVIVVPVNIQMETGVRLVSCFSEVAVDNIISADQLMTKANQSVCEIYLKNGDPIVETGVNPIKNQNLFSYYARNAVFTNGITLAQVKDDWLNGRSGYAVYEIKQFGKTYLYYKPIMNTDIMVTTFMRESDIDRVIANSSYTMIGYSIVFTLLALFFAVVVFIFISHLIKRDRDAQLQTEMERKANKAKTTFLFNMSHDIRTPMNAIFGYTRMAEKTAGNKRQTLEFLHKIKSASELLMSLINNVLEIARIESGNEHLDEAPWNFQKLEQIISSVFDLQMQEKNIEFIKNVQIEHRDVLCDSLKVREILLNLISNAYKYTPEGGRVTLDVKEIESEREGYATYRTIISDTGVGMSQEFLPHVFEEFSREKTTTESKILGTGLGMQIVKQYVDLMDGSIDIESEKGKGTSVVLVLTHPIIDSDYSKRNTYQSLEKLSKRFKGKRILLVEDNDMNAEISQNLLKEFGLMVELAGDGVACVDMIEKARDDYYDVILMDVQMPVMDGYEATRRIRTMDNMNKSAIPIIAMTANAFDEDIKTAMDSGMNGHIAKPIDPAILADTLKDFIHA